MKKTTEIVGLPGERIREVLARMIEHAPSYTKNLNGIDLEIDVGTTREQAVAKFTEAFRKRWNYPTFVLSDK